VDFYQASSKRNLAALGRRDHRDQQARYLKEVDRYKGERETIMPEARKLEEQSRLPRRRARRAVHASSRRATWLIQIAIALAAITILP
jgi:hypothetical protein